MHPFDYCSRHDVGDSFALLYSGMRGQGSGARSLLAYQPKRTLTDGSFADIEAGHWFGYAGYEMLHELEAVPSAPASAIALPRQWWFEPEVVQHFETPPEIAHIQDAVPAPQMKVASLASNMTTARYLQCVRSTIDRIHEGAFYQANITRKFYGEFTRNPNAFALFQRLCALSPSPYAAYLQLDADTAVLSSSPEGFLQLSEDGQVTARPIKGSAKAGDAALAHSPKDRAENLMIVDLMRNDLARCCEQGSVRVQALNELHQFSTISQLISTVVGQRRTSATALDVLRQCFPPGSMTGAPKVAAMRWCAAQEAQQRGVYSGALGWLNTRTQTADLSVVIRTLIIQGNRFEFQVGGGIVADSDPAQELQETYLKARAICQLLGIRPEQLHQL